MGEYRDEREAALHRAEALAHENARLHAELDVARGGRPPPRAPTRAPLVLAVLLGAGVMAGAALSFVANVRMMLTPTVTAPSLELRGQWSPPAPIASMALRGSARGAGGTWVVGDRGTILFRPEGSSQWSQVPSGTDADLYAIAAGPELVAVGAHGTALVFNPSERRWVSERTGVDDDLYAIQSESHVVVAVGARGTVVERDANRFTFAQSDANSSWSFVQSDATADLYGLVRFYSSDGGHLVAVGADGTIVDFAMINEIDDHVMLSSILTPTRQASPTHTTLRAVTAWNHTLVAVGDGGTVITAAERSPWTLVPAGTTEDLFAVAATEIPYEEHRVGYSSSGSTVGLVVAGAHGSVFVDRLGPAQGWRPVRAGGGAIRTLTADPWNLFTDDGTAITFAPR